MLNKPVFRWIFCVLAAGMVAGCGGGSGQPKLSQADKNFLGGIGSYDTDHDDVVTCDEWKAAAADMFAQADRSNDGVLVEADYRLLAKTDRSFQVTPFKQFDANADGKIDKAEFLERPNPAFAYADKDQDCKLTKPELLAAHNLSDPPVNSAKATKSTGAIGAGSPGGIGGGGY